MLAHIISYEVKSLFRSGWLLAIILLMTATIGFASLNGYQKANQRSKEISEAMQELKESDEQLLNNLDLIAQGKDTGLPYWKNPTQPSVIGSRHPRTVAMDAQPLAILATGQSDMYSHHMKTSTYGNNFALDISTISNPVQLLFGTFDLAFVFVFIIPLFIIAFTFNLLSREKESGTLRVVAAQPVSVTRWLFQKMLVRFVLFALVSIALFLAFLFFFAPQAFQHPLSVALTIFQIISYELFWFVMSGIVNVKINNTAKNAMTLIVAWLLIVLIIPVTANQLGASLYPAPSRLAMLNEIRQANIEIEKKQDEILDSYLRDHPELVDSTNDKSYNFWHKYFASQNILKGEIQPLIDDYQYSIDRRQQIVNYLKYLSPAIITQESFNRLAGTSFEDYNNYKEQVMSYTEAWRGHIIPLLFQDAKYSKSIHERRPVFDYKPLTYNKIVTWNIIATLFLMLIIVSISIFGRKNNLI